MESLGNCESKKDKLKVVKKLFKFVDENGDGKLSKAEAKAGFGRMDAWKGEMEDVFEELKDDKGEVSIKGEMNCLYESMKTQIQSYNFFIRFDEAHEGGDLWGWELWLTRIF